MQVQAVGLDNQDGWRLDLKRYWDPAHLDPELRPILIVPGYCMNTFILAYHPRGRSLVEHLCEAGHEVWTCNLRGQGDSTPMAAPGRVGFAELSLVDIPRAVDYVHAHTESRHAAPHAIGCSLGGTFLYAYLAHHPHSHGLASVVGLGAPLKWVKRHLLLKVAFRSPRVAAMVKLKGTRRIARVALPVLKHVPGLLSMYMNTAHIDLSNAAELTQTVDDPHPSLNVQIAHWVNNQDLVVRGLNVTEALAQVRLPLFAVHANGDGIVPAEVALSAVSAFGGPITDSLEAGDAERWFAHADMFINDEAEARVFDPLVDWLVRASLPGA